MTDRRFPSNAASDETDAEQALETDAPLASQDNAEDTATTTFRSDGGPGSVMRERQPGFGGLDARKAEEGTEVWQNVTSNQYGQRIETVVEEEAEEAPESPLPPR